MLMKYAIWSGSHFKMPATISDGLIVPTTICSHLLRADQHGRLGRHLVLQTIND